MAELNGYNARQLTSKHAQLRAEIETLPPGTKAATEKAQEAQRLQADLRRRLYSFMKGDVLPVLATAAKTIKLPVPSKKDLEWVDHQKICKEQIAGALGAGISFNVEVSSPLKTLVDRFKVVAPTKAEAWKVARERAKKYPGQVKIKIS